MIKIIKIKNKRVCIHCGIKIIYGKRCYECRDDKYKVNPEENGNRPITYDGPSGG